VESMEMFSAGDKSSCTAIVSVICILKHDVPQRLRLAPFSGWKNINHQTVLSAVLEGSRPSQTSDS